MGSPRLTKRSGGPFCAANAPSTGEAPERTPRKSLGRNTDRTTGFAGQIGPVDRFECRTRRAQARRRSRRPEEGTTLPEAMRLDFLVNPAQKPSSLNTIFFVLRPREAPERTRCDIRIFRCGCSSMVERQLPKLHTRVRFPSPAPILSQNCFADGFADLSVRF